jgi:Tfp pilus tip-associated adhesin PilY1
MILQDQSPCRGFYRVLDKQGDCVGHSIDHTGEQMLSQATLFFKTIYFTTYQAVFDDPCNPMGNAFIYAIDYSWGKASFNYDTYNDTTETVKNLSDTFQMISGSSIPSGVRVITRNGHAAGVISAGGAVAGAGENLSTSIPGPPGGVSRMLWETD